MNNFKTGLKLYSTDIRLISEAQKIREFFQFVELYTVPGSYKETIETWKEFNTPFVIHAPHSMHGVNFAQEDKWTRNLQCFNEARMFADALDSNIIIVHGGNNGSIDETIHQITLLNERRIAVENKPKVGIHDELCVGWSPSEFQKMTQAGVLSGFVLDFGHAACTACSLGIEVKDIISEFMRFNPKIFHISDGDPFSEKDRHFNLGKGGFKLLEFISVVPEDGLLTIETPLDRSKGLDNFIEDLNFLIK